MMRLAGSVLGILLLAPLVSAQNVEQTIREKTKRFTSAIVSKDLSILDEVFEQDPNNIYYDINEGPLVGFARLKRVWTAATTNYTISVFEFNDDMKIWIDGDHAVQAGTWRQTQVSKDGQSRDIAGRATILWRKKDGEWRVWHYHGSITPPRRPPARQSN